MNVGLSKTLLCPDKFRPLGIRRSDHCGPTYERVQWQRIGTGSARVLVLDFIWALVVVWVGTRRSILGLFH